MSQQRKPSASQLVNSQKVAIYIRVSTHWQVDKDSLQVQRRELTAYCQLVLGIQDYVIFEDPGYSAKNTDRPAYQQMVARLRTGEFSHVLVWKIDRISRNLLDFAEMYAELKRLGITFVSKNEQFDTSNAIGEAMLKIILVFAELERNMTSERVSAVMLSRASNGQWNGGRVPYGYKKTDDGQFVPEKKEKNTVLKIYDEYEKHLSCLYVANLLNDESSATRAGNRWSSVAIHKILTNPFYCGSYRYNVHQGTNGPKRESSEWITAEDHHEPIISKERFNTIQYLLRRNKRGGNQRGIPVQRKNSHIFAGLLECGNCGCNMTATPGKQRADGWTPSTYGCYNRRKSSPLCSNRYITDAALVPFVLGYISNILRLSRKPNSRISSNVLERKLLRGDYFEEVAHLTADTLEQMKQALLRGTSGIEYRPGSIYEGSKDALSEIASLEQRRKKAGTALARLKTLFLYGDNDIPEKDFILERKKIVDELNEIDARLTELQTDSVPLSSAEDAFVEKASYLVMVDYLLNNELDDPTAFIRSVDHAAVKSFVHTVLSKIVITDGRVAEIDFKNGMTHKFLYK